MLPKINSEIFACEQKIYSWTIEVKKWCQRHKLLILLFKNVLKISNFEKNAKWAKTLKSLKKQRKKNFKKFFIGAFMREEQILLVKKACFMLIFLNLKSKASKLFFWVASSLSILWCRACLHIYQYNLALNSTITILKTYLKYDQISTKDSTNDNTEDQYNF